MPCLYKPSDLVGCFNAEKKPLDKLFVYNQHMVRILERQLYDVSGFC